jgi:undecaprenyl diphosphate synthase|tara:strand:- start:1273 stop:1923 length:651 start_codon:yes stop_codon:yes gene_type:complete
MDGNGRWAKAQGKSRQYGHKIGSSKVYDVFKQCAKFGCESATFFAMSSENMLRSDEETEYISALLKSSIEEHFSDLLLNKTKFKVIGDITNLPDDIKEVIKNAEDKTKDFTNLKLYIAYNYGGQWDILNAVKSLVHTNHALTTENLNDHLSTKDDFPDLIVRTGGYKRLSNFMLWQSCYSELEFLDILWPDISEHDIKLIFDQYLNTKRNFGKIKK